MSSIDFDNIEERNCKWDYRDVDQVSQICPQNVISPMVAFSMSWGTWWRRWATVTSFPRFVANVSDVNRMSFQGQDRTMDWVPLHVVLVIGHHLTANAFWRFSMKHSSSATYDAR
jgi:hypothetical protein